MPEYLAYGGQAVIEGVMMRTPRYFSVACRAPNGEIVLECEEMEKTWIGRQKWLKLPFLRGMFGILDMLTLGTRCMNFATNVQVDPKYQTEEERAKLEAEAAAKGPKAAAKAEKIQNTAVGVAVFGGLALGIFLFQFLPNLVAQFLGANASDTIKNLVTEIAKVVFVVLYMYGISRLAEVQTLFKYHGAEHKAINTLEAHQQLTSENCRLQTRLHPRCGTSFAVVVIIISFVLFIFVPRNPFGLENQFLIVVSRVLVEFFLLLPIVAGVSYELIRMAGRLRDQKWVMALFSPGLLSQKFTTQEPTDDQIEVALAALRAVVHAEQTGEVVKDPALLADVQVAPALA